MIGASPERRVLRPQLTQVRNELDGVLLHQRSGPDMTGDTSARFGNQAKGIDRLNRYNLERVTQLGSQIDLILNRTCSQPSLMLGSELQPLVTVWQGFVGNLKGYSNADLVLGWGERELIETASSLSIRTAQALDAVAENKSDMAKRRNEVSVLADLVQLTADKRTGIQQLDWSDLVPEDRKGLLGLALYMYIGYLEEVNYMKDVPKNIAFKIARSLSVLEEIAGEQIFGQNINFLANLVQILSQFQKTRLQVLADNNAAMFNICEAVTRVVYKEAALVEPEIVELYLNAIGLEQEPDEFFENPEPLIELIEREGIHTLLYNFMNAVQEQTESHGVAVLSQMTTAQELRPGFPYHQWLLLPTPLGPESVGPDYHPAVQTAYYTQFEFVEDTHRSTDEQPELKGTQVSDILRLDVDEQGVVHPVIANQDRLAKMFATRLGVVNPSKSVRTVPGQPGYQGFETGASIAYEDVDGVRMPVVNGHHVSDVQHTMREPFYLAIEPNNLGQGVPRGIAGLGFNLRLWRQAGEPYSPEDFDAIHTAKAVVRRIVEVNNVLLDLQR